ncbi:hypothetical protein SAMN05877831_101510 [Rhodobacter maris]|uniref:Uncharacterized protein n=1 Tax=Rhodobacter maris TaxID=446682 RepID=A0A285RLI6_9RHOB|nr:hypothetical protein SAMN05877831_101510 [Rhodobacter maris]
MTPVWHGNGGHALAAVALRGAFLNAAVCQSGPDVLGWHEQRGIG